MVASRLLLRGIVSLGVLWLLVLVGIRLWPAAPNPNLLAFVHQSRNTPLNGLFVLDPVRNLSAPLVALVGAETVVDYTWSPDGRWLAYAQGGSPLVEGGQVVLRGPGGVTHRYPLAALDGNTDLHWHPDGSRLLVIYRPNRIMTIVPETGEMVGEVTAFDLQFIQRGTVLIFDPREMLVRGQGVQARRPSYFTVSLASGAARPAADLPCLDESPRDMALSPDGTQLIYGCFDAQVLFVAPTDDVDARESFAPLSELGRLGNEGSPRWSPDGKRVLFNHYPMFVQPNEPPFAVYAADLTTGVVESITMPLDAHALNWYTPEVSRRGR
jgi:WD40 repeat protein